MILQAILQAIEVDKNISVKLNDKVDTVYYFYDDDDKIRYASINKLMNCKNGVISKVDFVNSPELLDTKIKAS